MPEPLRADATVLGFDVGARRIGVAVGTGFGLGARALAVVDVHDEQIDWKAVEKLHREWRPAGFIVGDPMTLDGGDQPIRQRARAFARELLTLFALPVAMMDERNEALSAMEIQQVEIEVKYAGYIERQEAEISRFKTLEDKTIPTWLDFQKVKGLRTEARIKLGQVRPATLGQASRISGVSPADLAIVMVWMKRGETEPPPTQECAAENTG